MKNTLVDLQNHLFMLMEALNDTELTDEELDREIKRSVAFSEVAKIAVANGALMVKAADTLYGLPVSDKLPLIPPSPAENPVIIGDKRKALFEIPKVGREVKT